VTYDADRFVDPYQYIPPVEQQYTPPAYQEPVYTPAVEPVTQELAPVEQQYTPPAYQEPVYQPPVYQEPAYQPPAYNEPMTYDADQYSPAVDPYVAPNTAPLDYGAPVYNELMDTPYIDPYQYIPAADPYVAPAETPYTPPVEQYQPTPAAQPMTQEPAPVETPNMSPLEQGAQPATPEPAANGPLTLEQLAARVAPGRDPSQREQNIASQNLKATPYSINNFLEYGNGQGVAGGAPTTVGLYAGHNYTLVDNKTGEVLAQGSTPEEIQRIQEIANNLSATQGKNADWRLYDATPEAGITNMH
jgi:hypothetical protein